MATGGKQVKAVQPERLSDWEPIRLCDSPLLRGNRKRSAEMTDPLFRGVTKCDIDARVNFYGTYLILNEQVTLQNQDPVLNEASRRLGVSLNILGDNKPNLNTLETLRAA